jgi:hypothetical protein
VYWLWRGLGFAVLIRATPLGDQADALLAVDSMAVAALLRVRRLYNEIAKAADKVLERWL